MTNQYSVSVEGVSNTYIYENGSTLPTTKFHIRDNFTFISKNIYLWQQNFNVAQGYEFNDRAAFPFTISTNSF